MSIMIPPVLGPWVKSNAEKRIFSWFRDAQGTEDWIVLHSLNIGEHIKLIHGETDFLVIAPELGLFALEIKGGRVQRLNGRWHFTDKYNNTNSSDRSPFEQAWDGIYSILRYIKEHLDTAHYRLKDVLFGIGAMFPDVEYNTLGIENPAWQVCDLSDGANVRGFITRLSAQFRKDWQKQHSGKDDCCLPTSEEARWIASLLRPDFDLVVPPHVQIHQTESALIALTKEQYRCLDQLEDNPRCLMLGGAGTGKTLLAVEQARRCLANGERVGLFCYNNTLGSWLAQAFKAEEQKPLYVGTVHSYVKRLMETNGRTIRPTGEEDEYWKTELPLQAAKLVAEQFDRIIIDEAQDVLNNAYLKLFDAALKKGIQRGKWSMYGDFSMQAIYASEQNVQFMLDTLEDMTSFVRFRLTVNCRNTREICEAICTASGYRPPVKPWSRTSGPDVDRRSWKTPDEQYDKLASLLHELLRGGVAASGITILSPRKRENSVAARIQGIPVRNYTVPPVADVTFSTIHRFKGMENQVIILTDIMDYADSRLIYVAMSRARSKLYILENENATHEYDTLVFRRMMEK